MKKKQQKFLITGVIVSILVIALLAFGLQQSILGVSNYEDNTGNTHWLINGVADSVDEGYIFRSLPAKITQGDGDTVTPKEEAVLYVTKKESYCDFQLSKVTKNVNIKILMITIKTIDVGYYQLLSPERHAIITVKDDSGASKDIDGTLTQTAIFYDNGGKLEFKTVGTLGSNRECGSASNVALVRQSDGSYKIYDKADYDRKIGNLKDIQVASGIPIFGLSDIINYLRTDPKVDVSFVSNFRNYNIANDIFKGNVDIGSVQYTIDADAKYYNSVVYIKPKQVKPSVQVIAQEEVNRDGSYSAKAIITNQESSSGSIVVKATVNTGSVTGTGNFILNKTLEVPLIVKSPNKITEINLCVEACSTSSPVNCDKSCKTTSVVASDVNVQIKCGDKKCNGAETKTTCPQDCDDNDNNEMCIPKWYQQSGTKTYYKYSIFGIKAGPVQEPVCQTASWIIYSIIGFIIIGSVGIYTLIMKPANKRRSKRRSNRRK
jgi:hypothetical protein